MDKLNSDWDLDKFDPAATSARIRRFHLCALRNELDEGDEGDEAGPPPVNHWVLSLETSLRSSVTFNLVPGDGPRGKIEVTSLSERYARETLRVFSFEPMARLQVERIMALMQRQDFMFTYGQEGRRRWLSGLMDDLEAASFIPPGGAMVAWEALSQYWEKPEEAEIIIYKEAPLPEAE
ncbi:hypothetical protein F5X97DRAFT_344167 [Nemania serpens]|nr:hypothetical protein F5X97DRAFT_344167 [Nemania serpens]